MEKKTQAMEATEPAETAMEPKTLDTKDPVNIRTIGSV